MIIDKSVLNCKKMGFLVEDFPMRIHIGFDKLVDEYRTYLNGSDSVLNERAKAVIALADEFSELLTGIKDEKRLRELQPQTDELLRDLFSEVLQKNEIKVASLPFNHGVIKSTKRYQSIMNTAGDDFEPELKNFDQDTMYIMGCSIILGAYYGYTIDFRRPFYYEVPDAQGIIRHYRLLYNGDYIAIEKGPTALEITPEDVADLLDNFENIEMWKEKFPLRSWVFRGFVLANLYDATTDVAISDFKTSLLKYDKTEDGFNRSFQNIFNAIYNLREVKVGFSAYNEEDGTLERVPEKGIESFVLWEKINNSCESSLCPGSYQAIFTEHKFFAVSDVQKYFEYNKDENFYKKLIEQGIQSAIFAPITNGDTFLGLLEVVSPNKHELNSINANKLLDLMPYLVDTVLRAKSEAENTLELIIQEECTSIHSSVYWKFRQEAKRVLQANLEDNTDISFRDVVFKNVYPLFGQIDIKGSSDARILVVQKDLLLQLENAKKIVTTIKSIENMPIYDELLFRIGAFTKITKHQFEVDSERRLLEFFTTEIQPLFKHAKSKDRDLENMIRVYQNSIEHNMGVIYKHRKAYDESVMLINKKMAAVLDKKQKVAQAVYPHFFERFKTDGVEHNMYIGESITKSDSFNKIYLYNLRLWQLQVMCEMENEHYQLSRKLSHPLDVASMILVFNTSLSVRFRMDEKRFDVDGTYNARYEVVKKRVDKAFVKGTQERVTQPGKITIVYSQKEDEREYLRYIKFLQSKKYVGKNVDIVELQDLQAVTGLKAIRVDVLYKARNGEQKSYYTYDDLMKEISS